MNIRYLMLHQRKVGSFTKEQLNDSGKNLDLHNSEIRSKPSKTFTTVDNRYKRKHQNHSNSNNLVDIIYSICYMRVYVK